MGENLFNSKILKSIISLFNNGFKGSNLTN